jgi:hypothetical protein
MLYYNDVHNLALNTLYDQIDDRLHMYFHTVDIMMKQNFVQILPFTYNMNYEYEADLAAFHDTWNLSAKEISDIVRFNIDNTDIEEIDKTLYDQMVSFITQSLKYVTTYEHGYKSWVNDRPVKTIYHQSYDRAEHYMHTGDIYNLEPFQQPEVVMMDVDEDMDSIPDLSPPSYDMLKMDDFSWDVSAISSNEQKAVEPVDDAMIFLCKKFTGVCM